jgi:Zn-dependent peptidase ImmA (M78 family)
MLLAYRRLKELVPSLNKRSHTAQDFWRIVEGESVFVSESYLKKRGYFAIKNLPPEFYFIFLQYNPAHFQWLETAFHELVHYFLHYPCDFLLNRHQCEAEEFALVFLIAEKDLPYLVANYAWQDEYFQLLIYRRLQVLHHNGI